MAAKGNYIINYEFVNISVDLVKVLFLSKIVEVRLMATGDAPIMKQKNYKVDNDKKIEWIIAFIRKYLKLEESESLVSEFEIYNFFIDSNSIHSSIFFVSVCLCQSSFFPLSRPISWEPV